MTSLLGHLSLGFIATRILKTNRRETLLILAMSVLPDIDVLLPLAGILPWSFHRTITHSLFFVLAVSIPLFLVNRRVMCLSALGLILHIALDCGDTLGVPILYPLSFILSLGLWNPVHITLSGGLIREDLIVDYSLLLIAILITTITKTNGRTLIRRKGT